MNTLYYGDNLDVLPRVATESVDLIYLDPPFKSDAKYNVLFRTLRGDPSSAQIHAFDDTWRWSLEAEGDFGRATAPNSDAQVAVFLRAMFQVLGKSDVMAYLVMMAPRLVEMRRVLKDTGSIYLHCDPTAGHYLKMLMDAVFGARHFINEIVWFYPFGGRSRTHFSRKHDTIFWYAKSDAYVFNADSKAVRVPITDSSVIHNYRYTDEDGRRYRDDPRKSGKTYRYYLDEGKVPEDVWMDIDSLHFELPERLGYPTQKPVKLLERIIAASSNEGDVVLDPFCGCGTAVDAAQQLRRQWIGVDITYIAVDLIRNRLIGRYGKDILGGFKVDGIPQDFEGAAALAARNKIDFERWAVSMVRGQPTPASGDKGVDGWVYFARTYKEPLDVGKIVVSVKGGEQLKPGDVRDLSGTVVARGAQMGLLLTLENPTRDMPGEAAANGSYIHEATGTIYPKIQLMTVSELLDDKQPKIPSPLPPYQQATWAPGSEAVSLF